MSDVPSSTLEAASIMAGLKNDDETRTNDFLNWSQFFTPMFPFCCGFLFYFYDFFCKFKFHLFVVQLKAIQASLFPLLF